ncbi:MAG: 5-(carboxyamino)imidazole ribonucleotide synthase [Alphaproteobacteria bacterium]
MTEAVANGLPPGSVIGILGGGQLGRMTALAAAQLGYRCHIYDPDPGGPAAQVAAFETNAEYEDTIALDSFASAVDVVTFEFENVPVDTARHLARRIPVRPSPKSLEVAQDRIVEKAFLNEIGVPTAPYAGIETVRELSAALSQIGRPAVLKTVRLGYDGKGQVMIGPESRAAEAFAAMGASRGILEGWIDFEMEISVIVARGLDGAMTTYDPSENRHVNHILKTSLIPAQITPTIATEAQDIAERIATALDLVGLLAVELFVTRRGTLLANEIAPRPHNSGHWTMDACATGQFEQFVRAICGLPLGAVTRHADVTMTNLIGDEVYDSYSVLAEPNARLHLYGKNEPRTGRKMGHVNRLYPPGGLPR